MPAPSHCFLLLAMLALPAFDDSLSGQDAGIPEFSASPGSLFTAAEISRARRVAAENRERRESYIRARGTTTSSCSNPTSSKVTIRC
jgi:hypothetical protein